MSLNTRPLVILVVLSSFTFLLYNNFLGPLDRLPSMGSWQPASTCTSSFQKTSEEKKQQEEDDIGGVDEMAALSRSSLRGFLGHARRGLQRAIREQRNVNLVIGNESADLDSITSAIILAYIRSHAPPKDAFSPLYVPIINIPAADISLRTELLALVSQIGLRKGTSEISASSKLESNSSNIDSRIPALLTLSDLPPFHQIERALPPSRTKWLLVDHNALQGRLGTIYSHRVSGVIDHHDEENKVPPETGSEPRIVRTSGSCTSLVVEYCRAAWDQIASREPTRDDSNRSSPTPASSNISDLVDDASREAQLLAWDAQLARLALASILIDTNDLTSRRKTTSHDASSAAYLEKKIRASLEQERAESGEGETGPPPFDRSAFYGEIDDAKRDLTRLTVQEVLRKDYKEWVESVGEQEPAPEAANSGEDSSVRMGISSVIQDVAFLYKKARNEDNSSSPSPENTTLPEDIPDADINMPAANTPPAAPSREQAGALHDHLFRFATSSTETTSDRLDLAVIMLHSKTPQRGNAREIVLLARGTQAVAAANRFLGRYSGELGLVALEGYDLSDGKGEENEGDGKKDEKKKETMFGAWMQTKVHVSRKQVAPMLRSAIRGT